MLNCCLLIKTEFEAEDVYEDFYEDKKLLDFSDYSLNS